MMKTLRMWETKSKEMVFSTEKTKISFISTSEINSQQQANNDSANIKINNTTIDEVNNTKVLGVNLDTRLV